MSFWCPKGRILGACALLLASGVAGAQQIYFQPMVQVGVEGDTNRNLITTGDTFDKNGKKDSVGYNVDASGLLGIATPRSNSMIKPEVVYADYPTLHTNDLRTSLDLNSQFRSSRGVAGIEGRFDRESTYSAELANPQFNQVAPNLPNTPETGRISSDTTRTLVTAVPTYTLDLSPRFNWGVSATFQDVSYAGTNATSYVPFDYYLGQTSLTYLNSERLDTTLGVVASHESGKDDSGQVNAYGVNVAFGYKWSKLFTGRLLVSVERDYSDVRSPSGASPTTQTNAATGATSVAFLAPVRSTTTGAGATYVTTWQGEIQKLQLSIGRTYTPSGAGGTFAADQLQAEYQRDLAPRLQFEGAVRYVNETSVSVVFRNADYSYVNATANLKWKMTPTWYLTGGVEYLYERFVSSVGNASNATVFVAVGYQGLGRRT